MATQWLSASNRIFRVVAMSYVSTTVTPNGATTDVGTITLNTATTTMAAPSGTPLDGQKLTLRLKQDGTGGRLVTWNSIYTFTGLGTPVLSVSANAMDLIGFQYNSASSKWEAVGVLIADATVAGTLVGYNERATDFGPYTSSTRVMSTIAPVRANRVYLVGMTGECLHSGAGSNVHQHELRYTTNNTEPTTSSTFLARQLINTTIADVPMAVSLTVPFTSSADGFFRVAICSSRPVGSQNAVWTTPGGAGASKVFLTVIDAGPAVSQSGTDY